MIDIKPLLAALFLAGWAYSGTAHTAADDEEEGQAESVAQASDCRFDRRYTFSWSVGEHCDWHPRGGTTTGTPVTVDPDVHPGWLKVRDEDLSDFERDRQAILAMSGPYQASFEFLETVGYTPDFEPDRPYQSWGTEYIHVVEDRQDFISLQHIMVMFFQDGDEISGPMVMKHWRQDWAYQKQELLSYVGNNTWRKQKLADQAVQGHWAQAVYQVDDSPRYESYGRWQHKPNFSTWQSELTWRPLPRREGAVRDDYQVLEGYNRHTIVPDGWVHEEENYKVKLDQDGNLRGDQPYLAKEQGVNRYQRIVDFDFSAGDEYWAQTQPYWRLVREEWQRLIDRGTTLHLQATVDGEPLFAILFADAERFRGSESTESETRDTVREVLQRFSKVE